MKICRKCSRSLPLNEFTFRKPGGSRKTQCRECIQARAKMSRAEYLRAESELTEKPCSKCFRILPVTSFQKHGGHRIGLTASCKDCIRTRRIERENSDCIDRREKTCPKCERMLPITAYSRKKGSLDGREWRCRECLSIQQTDARVRMLKAGIDRDIPSEAFCSQCEQTLPATAFTPHVFRTNGLQKTCRLCVRVRKYGLTKSQYDSLLLAQDNKCASCRIELAHEAYRGASPVVDHDHNTGIVRGILCLLCNAALGNVKDDPEILLGLMRYLGYEASLEVRSA